VLLRLLLDAADIGTLHPRWEGPFTVTATVCPIPKACTLALPRRMQCSPTVSVDRLKPFHWHERADAPPAAGPGQEGEHEVDRKSTRGVTRYLVRWRGHTSAAEEWLRAELHCPENVAEYGAAALRLLAGRRVAPADGAAVPAAVGALDHDVGGTVPLSRSRSQSAGPLASGSQLATRTPVDARTGKALVPVTVTVGALGGGPCTAGPATVGSGPVPGQPGWSGLAGRAPTHWQAAWFSHVARQRVRSLAAAGSPACSRLA
jgi:hypothetical protein